jgi:putative phosphoesterase
MTQLRIGHVLSIGSGLLKIGVISDTHIKDVRQGNAFLQALAERYFADAEIILHAGDVVNPDILMAFADRTVHLVRGNMDPAVKGVPSRKIIKVGGFRIGLIHGWGAPDTLEERVQREFNDDRLDCLVFGHSHQPLCRRRDGILLFNPGSPTDRRWAPFHSVGILELGEGIEGRIIHLDD